MHVLVDAGFISVDNKSRLLITILYLLAFCLRCTVLKMLADCEDNLKMQAYGNSIAI